MDFFSKLTKKILKRYKMKISQSDMENWGLRGSELHLVEVALLTIETSPSI